MISDFVLVSTIVVPEEDEAVELVLIRLVSPPCAPPAFTIPLLLRGSGLTISQLDSSLVTTCSASTLSTSSSTAWFPLPSATMASTSATTSSLSFSSPMQVAICPCSVDDSFLPFPPSSSQKIRALASAYAFSRCSIETIVRRLVVPINDSPHRDSHALTGRGGKGHRFRTLVGVGLAGACCGCVCNCCSCSALTSTAVTPASS